MPPRPRTPGGGDGGDAPTRPRTPGGGDSGQSVSQLQDTTARAISLGRPAGAGPGVPAPGGGPGTPPRTQPGGAPPRDPGGPPIRDVTDPADTSTPAGGRTTAGDPIDVATGEVVMTQTDVRLAGVLPLVLSRTHVSSYRVGRWFGPSWASTLDQRLEVDAEGVCYAAADGMLLFFPVPGTDGRPVPPVEGPRLSLTATMHGYQVTDPAQGYTWHFVRPGDELRPGVRSWPLSMIGDRNGNRIDLDYDEAGVLTAVRHSGGYHLSVESSGGRITALRLGEQELARYGYDASRQLTEVYNSSGAPTVFDYDPAGRLISWTDRIGGWYRYDYDSTGRCVRTTGADGVLECRIAYDDASRTTSVTDSLGHARRYVLNRARQIVQEIDPLGRVTAQEWGRFRQLLSRTDPLGRTTTYHYDEDGNLVEVVRPDGARTTATYNQLRLPVTITEPDGAVRRFEYDQRGNLLAATGPTGGTTRYAYNRSGHLVSMTSPTGGEYRIETDAAGLPVAKTDISGAVTRYRRDGSGRPVETTDPVGGVRTFEWTLEGRLARRTSPDGAAESWHYDAEGNLVEYADPMGRTTKYEIGQFGLATAETAPDGTRLSFDYDTELRLVAVTNPQGLVWRYEYDAAGQLVAETDFNGHTSRYHYDAAGALSSRTNAANETTSYLRDLAGNVTEQRSSGKDTSFRYDAAGRLVYARNPDAELVITRDRAGRVTAETCNGATINFGYDEAGRPTYRRTPSGAESVWTYDSRGLPETVRIADQTVRFTHDPAGRQVDRRLDTGLALAQSWDLNHRMVSQTLTVHPAGTTLRHRLWRRRIDGNLTGVDDSQVGSRRFDLDPNGRVTAVTGDGWSEGYAYDPSGNLSEAIWPTTPESYPADHDAQGPREYRGTLITRAGRTRYEHDSCGRMTLRQHEPPSGASRAWLYTWDSDDRLTAVTAPDATRWRYSYDPLGRRIAKQRIDADGTVAELVRFTWAGPVIAEQSAQLAGGAAGAADDRVTTWDWSPGTFLPLAQTERRTRRGSPVEVADRRFYLVVTDLVGTPTELVAPDGHIAWHRQATLWGSSVAGFGEVDCPLRSPGQYFDAETGAHYNVHRFYEPANARYQSPDPIGLAPSPNPHAYVPNPHRWIDPLGLQGCQVGDGTGDPPNLYTAGGPRVRPREGDPPRGDIDVDESGMVYPPTPENIRDLEVQGLSTYDSVDNLAAQPLSGQVRAPNRPLPEGLGIIADHEGVGGPMPPGHHTIYPTRPMQFTDFEQLIKGMDWQNIGTKLKPKPS